MAENRKFSYSRQSKSLELMPEKSPEPSPTKTAQTESNKSVPTLRGYEKTDGVLSYHLVCVISGGERKEKDFLRELIRQRELHSLRVAFLSEEGQGLQPYQMQERWREIQTTGHFVIAGQHYQLDAMDKVFLLSDVDEFYDQLIKIVAPQGGSDSGQWIVSNPCFEIWLYYCFRNEPQKDLASLSEIETDKRSQAMKHLGHTIVPGGLSPLVAFENMADGIAHSLEHYAEDDNAIPQLFATQMYVMAQYLMETMNRNANEYDEFVRQKREWREKMRQISK